MQFDGIRSHFSNLHLGWFGTGTTRQRALDRQEMQIFSEIFVFIVKFALKCRPAHYTEDCNTLA
jgi:uncharacterized protein YfaT (DUF1175 family)